MTSKNLHLITGQFGDVYTAEMNRSTVAVKVIKRFSSKRVKEQFENEMTIMSQVSHNNVVRLHGIIRNGERKIIIRGIESTVVDSFRNRSSLTGIGDGVFATWKLEVIFEGKSRIL